MSNSFAALNWSLNSELKIGRIVLDRPEKLNTLSTQLRRDIVGAFRAFEELDDEARGVAVRCVIVEGAGDRAFCAGADINYFEDHDSEVFAPDPMYEVCESFGAPVIAKIDGYCLGGGLEFALTCDFRLASERSELGFPEIDLGFIPGSGGTQRLATVARPSRVKELCMTGDRLTGKEAGNEQIVDYVHPAAELDEKVDELAETLTSKPPLAVRAVKDVVNRSSETNLREGRRYERRVNQTLRQTHDFEEGTSAFAEDRAPEWAGR